MDEDWKDIARKDAELKDKELSAFLGQHSRNFHLTVPIDLFREVLNRQVRPAFHRCSDALYRRWLTRVEAFQNTSDQLGLSGRIDPCELEGIIIIFSRKRFAIAEPTSHDPRFAVLYDPGKMRVFAVSWICDAEPDIVRLSFDSHLVELEDLLKVFAKSIVGTDPLETPDVPVLQTSGFVATLQPCAPV